MSIDDLRPVSSASPSELWRSDGSFAAGVTSLLSEPTGGAVGSGDALSELMIALQKQSDSSMAMTTTRIQDTRSSLNDQMKDYLEKMAEIARKLQEAKNDDGGGFFGDCFDFIGDLVGEIVGTLADLAVDAITMPVDLAVDIGKNINDPAAMLQAMQASGMKLVENGTVAEDVHGFTKGVVAFAGDLAELTAKLSVDLAAGVLTGEGLSQAVGGDMKKLWGSLKTNILDNPHFWAVTGAIAKGVAIAGTAMTGGALSIVAIGLMVAMEMDHKTGFVEKMVGKDAAPWVRLGMAAATAVCLGFAGGADSGLLKTLQLATGLTNGAGTIYKGVRTIQLANERADALEQQAQLDTSLNRMQRLQRLLETLLSSLDEDSKSSEQTRSLGTSLLQTQVATNSALIFPA
jgi:hypothetical protein